MKIIVTTNGGEVIDTVDYAEQFLLDATWGKLMVERELEAALLSGLKVEEKEDDELD